jgi:serine/threonine protein kinase
MDSGMTPERWRQIVEVFNSAVEQGSRAEEFLRVACSNDNELYSKVRYMLEEDMRAGPLDQGPCMTSAPTSDLRLEAEPLSEFYGTDRFSILRRMGAGAMGEVYEALDRKRDERVALKRLSRTEPSLIYRFKQEFRPLSEIVHPNIVQLLAPG